MSGESNVVLTGGVDSMSQAPHVVRNARFGIPLGSAYVFEDSLWTGLTDTYCQLPMALTAEKLAEQYKITRQEVDKFALRSQTLWQQGKNKVTNNFITLFKFKICTHCTNFLNYFLAQDNCVFSAELAPVTIKVKKADVVVDVDEHPKPKTTLETLGKLPTVFKKNGVVTAGSASVRAFLVY